ncbi:MAG: capsule assembly Wzi family protein, partial [Gammaproteobacteria bacterium]|nr:capsule assembly Wzi family protein [Gammaproteobacteria bacterium]
PCGWRVLKDLLLGRDNRDASLTIDDEPGNQMAGYDLRLRAPWRAVPLVLYTQWIGEDEAGGLPSKFLGLFGIETWFASRFGSVRLRSEYADTACTFTRRRPQFDCGYRNGLYPQGYTYRGRIIGHTLDNDSRQWSVAALLVQPSGATWSLTLRNVDANRGGSVPDNAHALSPRPAELSNVEFQYNRRVMVNGADLGQVQLGIGFDDARGPIREAADVRGFLQWRQDF